MQRTGFLPWRRHSHSSVAIDPCLWALLLVVLLSGSAAGQAAGSEAPAPGIPFEAALRDADVKLASMANGQSESLILGNGDLYGIVWEKDGSLFMRITKNDIWDARIDTSQDPPLPKVDIPNNTVSGKTHAPPSYKHPYPHPRCAAALRLGEMISVSGVRWSCIRVAPQHDFEPSADEAAATMRVAGAAGASTGYRAVLSRATEASSLLLRIKGSTNAKYYVNVYDKDRRNILATGWRKSPAVATEVEIKFEAQTIRQVEVYTMTSDGAVAENHLDMVSLCGEEEKTPLLLPQKDAAVLAALDLRHAVATVNTSEESTVKVRVLADRNVVLIESDEPVVLEPISAATLPDPVIGETDGIAWLHAKLPGDQDYGGMEYALAVASRGTLKAVSVVTSFDIKSRDVRPHAVALARQTLQEKKAALVASHERSWHEFWSRSGIELADRDMQRWWYRLLYFARTISRPGAAPPGLMPPLATDATPWHADYHFNYNSWQPFYSVVSSNHPELADSWITYVHGLLPRARWLAREGYSCDGVFYSISQFLHEPDPAVCKSKNRRQIHMNPWGLTIGMVGMTAQSLWHKHLCQPDREYLEAKIYPSLREAARFYISFMEQCKKDKNGKVILGPSYSPEHGPFGIADCPFDIAYAQYTFEAFRRAARELGKDGELAARCLTMMNLLADYPVALDAAGKPVVVDWAGCKYKQVKVHNITVPVTPVFPAEQVTWFSPRPVVELFRRTIRDTRFNGNNSHIIYNFARARLSMPEGFTESRAWFKSRELPNGLFVWKGHAHGTFMPESIGIVALITEFLMQSVGDTIRVFPCWPEQREARFSRLRAQGGFLVSAEYARAKVQSVTIESTVGGRLRLLSPWTDIKINGKQVAQGSDAVVEVQTRAGDIFRFAPGEQ